MTRIFLSLCNRITSARLFFAKLLVSHWKAEIIFFFLAVTKIFKFLFVNGYLKFKLVQGIFVVLVVLQLELQVSVNDDFLKTSYLSDTKGVLISFTTPYQTFLENIMPIRYAWLKP
jgi:hypothetical protein